MDTIDRVNLSFSGCGFLGIYHVGVASCFLEYCPQVCFQKISGASFGALVATALACNLPLGESTSDILKVVIKARSRALGPFHPAFDINNIVKDALLRALPEDAHSRVNGRLHISVTRLSDGCNVILNQFESKEDLIQALLCSCFIPFWSGIIPPKFHGVAYIDGGFSINLLNLDDNSITISPFSGESDICPQDSTFNLLQLNLANTSISISPGNMYRLTRILFPPHPEIMKKMCQQGFDDALRFLQRTNRISCVRCVASRFVLAYPNHPQINQHFRKLKPVPSRPSIANGTPSNSTAGFTGCGSASSTTEDDGDRNTSHISTNENAIATVSTTMEEENDEGVDLNEENFDIEIDIAGLDNCIDCHYRRQMVVFDTLPITVSKAIQDACDQVNNGLINWIFKHRPVKILSILTIPYILPFDIAIVIVIKLWNRLPYLRNEIIKRLYQLIDFTVKNIVDRLNSSNLNSVHNGSKEKIAFTLPSELHESETYSLINSRIIINR